LASTDWIYALKQRDLRAIDNNASIRHIQKSGQKHNRRILKPMRSCRLENTDFRHSPAGLNIRSRRGKKSGYYFNILKIRRLICMNPGFPLRLQRELQVLIHAAVDPAHQWGSKFLFVFGSHLCY
jgi:hypothetical protein